MHFPDKLFGDPFDIERLTLRRPAQGYAVQKLNTDLLLDRQSGVFLPVRSADLKALFSSYQDACCAAECWLQNQQIASDEHELAIVPASFDPQLQRHILVYGVLRSEP